MRKIYLIFGLIFGLQTIASAQLTCGDTFVDSGGSTAAYNNGEQDTTVICPGNTGDAVSLVFSLFATENNFDTLFIFDGNSTSGNLIAALEGLVDPVTYTATNMTGCLTAVFSSDGSVIDTGWVASITCATNTTTCYTPGTIISNNVTDLTAQVSWTAGGSETQWIVEYGVAGFPLGTGMQIQTSNNPLTLTNLSEVTDYDFYVRSYCGVGDSSFQSLAKHFTTEMTPLAPFICGNQFTDPAGANGVYTNGIQDTIVICPTNTGDAVSLVFTLFDTESGFDNLQIFDGNSTNGNLIADLEGQITPGTITASSASGCLTTVFHTDGSLVFEGWVANITCSANTTTCFTPLNVTIDTLTDMSAEISWTSDGTETQWIVEYDSTGFTLGTGTQVLTSSNPFTISDLAELTTYDFYVSAYCGAGDTSNVSSVTTFTTAMTPLAPFICGNLFTDAGGVNGNYSAFTNDTIVLCPGVPGDLLSLVFTAFEVETGYDTMFIYDGNTVAGNLLVTTDELSPGTVTATNATGCLTVVFQSDNIVQFAGWSALIDCEVPVVCDAPTSLTTAAVGPYSATLNWTSTGVVPAFAIEYGPIGFTQGTGTVVGSTTTSVTISGLTQNTPYNFYVTAICTIQDSATSTVGSFSTLSTASINELQINTMSINPNPSNGKFVITNKSEVSISSELFDAQGRKLNLNLSNLDSNKELIVDLSSFENGVYFIKTASSLGNKTYSLVKN